MQAALKKSIIFGSVSGLYYGLLAMTCFYIAWYFVFYICIFILVLFILNLKDINVFIRHNYKNVIKYLLSVSFAYLVGIAPFIYTFYEKSKEVGVRSYELVYQHTVPIENILQVGNENLFLGKLYNYFLLYISNDYTPNGEYYNSGFPFILFFIFLIATISHIQKYKTDMSQINQVLLTFSISTIIVLLLVLKIKDFSLWVYVYNYFPGAQALNAIETIMIFLVIPILLVTIKYISKLKLPSIILYLVSFILIISELNTPYLNLNRSEQLNVLNVEMPPKECKVFYVTGLSNQDKIEQFPNWINNYYAHNVIAIFIAQNVNIPTINGIASFNPPDWNFGFPNNDDYENRVSNYIEKHNIKDICRLDLNKKIWKVKNDLEAN